MKRIHIIGGKNHGKTTLVTDLVAELQSRGMRVGTIKHTHHQHELDTPGKDSHRHREAGASVVGILSCSMNAVFWPKKDPASQESGDERYNAFTSAFADCDLVLVEGDTRTSAPKLEVWRAVNDTPPIANHITDVRMIVTDDPIETAVPVLARANVSAIADFILEAN
jgi:molybdopterin-guanine dinucleotide biosynthesis protein B